MPQLQKNTTKEPDNLDILSKILGFAIEQQKNSLNPYQEGVAKGLKQSGEQHAIEALQQGVPSNHIVQESQLSPIDLGTINVTKSMSQQQPNNLQQANSQNQYGNTPMGLLSRLVGFDLNPEVTGQRLQNQTVQQQLRGEQPLQQGEKEKIRLESQNQFFNSIGQALNKTPSAEESKLLSNVDSGINQIDLLSEQLEKNPNIFKGMTMPGNETRQSIVTMRDDLTDILGRLRSGGAINKDEEARFKNQLFKIGLAATFENPKVAKFKLNKLRNLFQDIKSTVMPRNNDFANKIMELRKKGISDEQIYRAYRGQ